MSNDLCCKMVKHWGGTGIVVCFLDGRCSLWQKRHRSSDSTASGRDRSYSSDSADTLPSRLKEEPWLLDISSTFLQQYVQYLQSMGFILVQVRPQSPARRSVSAKRKLLPIVFECLLGFISNSSRFALCVYCLRYTTWLATHLVIGAFVLHAITSVLQLLIF